ncbi:MAG: glucosamine-6-phosphate deaminase [Desulfitobacteriaceae bacterium]
MTNIKLGTAKVDITPQHPIPLAGFVHRHGHFEGVSHPLHAKVFLFQQSGDEGEIRQILLVSADLIWWGTDRLPILRSRLKQEFGLSTSSIILHATHNHSGPQTSGLFTPSLGKLDLKYVQELEEKLVEGVRSTFQNLEPVTIERGGGECDFSIHRRKVINGQMTMAPNPDGPTDPEVTVIRFLSNSGTIKALLVHYTCHAATTGDNVVSSEFPGVAMDYVEEQLGGEIVAAYLQGFCGDVRPALIHNSAFYRGNDKEVCRLGQTLGNEVICIARGPMQALLQSSLVSLTFRADLPFQELPTSEELHQKLTEEGIQAEWAELLMSYPERIRSSIPLEISWVQLAEGLSLLTANAEMVVHYGLLIKDKFSGQVLPVGYTNGMIGYVPTAEQIAEGGYEAKDSGLYFGLPAPFASTLEEWIYPVLDCLKERKMNMMLSPNPIKPKPVERLQVQVYQNRIDMGTAAAHAVAQKMKEILRDKGRVRMIFAAAPSQNEVLARLAQDEEIDWSRVTVFHMDEYIGLPDDDSRRFGRFLEDRLFGIVNPGEVYLIQTSQGIEEECARYGELLCTQSIDIVCLGIGENGHIAFNDPWVADFNDPKVMKSVELDQACRIQQVHDECFPTLDAVPTHAMTLTIPTIMSGAHLYCIVPGRTKHNAVKHTLHGPVTTDCPASILRRHPDCTMYLDTDSYGDDNL